MISITRRVYFKRAAIAIFLVFLIWIAFLIWPQTASADATAKPSLKEPVVQLQKNKEPDRWSEKKIMLRQATTTTTTTTAPKPLVSRRVSRPAPSSVVVTKDIVLPPLSADQDQVAQMIRDAAAKYGVDVNRLLRVAQCESNFHTNSINIHYTAGGGHPSGVFQFLPGTWTNMSNAAGYAGADVFDGLSNVNVAAWAFAHGQSGQWACH